MDQNPQGFDDVLKNEVKKNLVDAMILGLQAKRLTFGEMRASANFILDNIENIRNYSDLVLFLDNLKNQWSAYSNILIIYKNKFYQDKEKILINKLSEYITSNIKN